VEWASGLSLVYDADGSIGVERSTKKRAGDKGTHGAAEDRYARC
jgi:hypothetical protein